MPKSETSTNEVITNEETLAAAFEEWLRRYNENPEEFDKEYGEPKSYGVGCAAYMVKLLNELSES